MSSYSYVAAFAEGLHTTEDPGTRKLLMCGYQVCTAQPEETLEWTTAFGKRDMNPLAKALEEEWMTRKDHSCTRPLLVLHDEIRAFLPTGNNMTYIAMTNAILTCCLKDLARLTEPKTKKPKAKAIA